MQHISGITILFLCTSLNCLTAAEDDKAGEELLGTERYENFEKPAACGSCHVDFFMQWQQAMMSQAYTHHWDEIEYFKLAVPTRKRTPKSLGLRRVAMVAMPRWPLSRVMFRRHVRKKNRAPTRACHVMCVILSPVSKATILSFLELKQNALDIAH
jgi:hypothetical protein